MDSKDVSGIEGLPALRSGFHVSFCFSLLFRFHWELNH